MSDGNMVYIEDNEVVVDKEYLRNLEFDAGFLSYISDNDYIPGLDVLWEDYVNSIEGGE